jgi:hypothetical protein
VLKEIIEEAKILFALMRDFNVSRSGNLEVLHPGDKSLSPHVEVVFKAYLITTAELSRGLNVN